MDEVKIAILQDRLNRIEQSRFSDPDLQKPTTDHVVRAAEFLIKNPGTHSVTLAAIAKRAETSTTFVLQRFVDIERFVGGYIRQLISADENEWTEIEKKHPNNLDEQLRSWVTNVGDCLAAHPDAPLPLPVEAAILLYDHHPERDALKKRKTELRKKLAQVAAEALYRDPEGLAIKLLMLLEGSAALRAIFDGEEGEEVVERFFEVAFELFKRHTEPCN